MKSVFPVITERRYKRYQRRYANEYFFDGRRAVTDPNATFKYSTLEAAKKKAKDAIDTYGAHRVQIFDHKTGQYVRTYKRAGDHGITWLPGCVR